MTHPAASPAFVRLPALKTAQAFRDQLARLELDLPCDDGILGGPESPLALPAPLPTLNGKSPGNRWAIQPMEGWDATPEGGVTEDVRRRWQRFGESGAKLIAGGEAMAVRPDGRANPRQLVIHRDTLLDLTQLRQVVQEAHCRHFESTADLVIGFQLTHSGRFSRPHGAPAGRVAFRHPLLDTRFGITSDAQVFTDEELADLVPAYVQAAGIAREAGADFVDIKHCHGYLLHELLAAHTRPGRYGGTFENRTRLLREIVAGIRASGNPIDLAVRVSAFDFVPFQADHAASGPGKPGRGIPTRYDHCLPYRYAFGVNPEHPLEPDLTETLQFAQLCAKLGIRLLNLSAGSPYYNPHIQRPAAYPPSDGYAPPEDPLVGVTRQIQAVRHIRSLAPPGLLVLGSAYSYLQEYLPHVAQAVLRQGWTDFIGIGRAVLSYPRMLADAVQHGRLQTRAICRTFSDCTTAPRAGLVSGCYPLDPYYAARPEAPQLKAAKRTHARH